MTRNARFFFFIITPVLFCLSSPDSCVADTVYLKRLENAISLNVNKVTEKFITATIRKDRIINISIKPDRSKRFPDTIYFSSNPRANIRCKVIDITNNAYVIKLPMVDIESLELNPEKINNQSSRRKDDRYRYTDHKRDRPYTDSHRRKQHKSDLLDMEFLEEMEFEDLNIKEKRAESDFLVREYLPGYEINNRSKIYEYSRSLDTNKLKEEIKKELIDAMNKQKVKDEEAFLRESTGKVTGKIFRNGKPYPNCAIKIVALTKERFLLSKVIKRGENFETLTDENGMYYFKNVTPGNYKLFWKPSYETSWIRRMHMNPDFIVSPGRTTFTKSLEIAKRVIN
ncbi:MAG: carboxypeptidase-like regulatory domain-containing protein [Candidatus Anammoxibacter sp.]